MNFWIILSIIITLVILLSVVLWAVFSKPKKLSLQKKSRLLTPAEKSFFECLVKELSDEFYLFGKMSVLDVVKPFSSLSSLQKGKHARFFKGVCFDYVICKRHDMSIYGVIELENFDRTDNKREILINKICKSANLKLFYFDVKQNYEGVDIKRLITGKSSVKKKAKQNQAAQQRSQMTIDDSSYAVFSKRKVCPKCNGEVAVKVAVRGDNIGEKFLMCRKYPYCDYKMSLTDKKVIDIKRRDLEESKRSGFKDWS